MARPKAPSREAYEAAWKKFLSDSLSVSSTLSSSVASSSNYDSIRFSGSYNVEESADLDDRTPSPNDSANSFPVVEIPPNFHQSSSITDSLDFDVALDGEATLKNSNLFFFHVTQDSPLVREQGDVDVDQDQVEEDDFYSAIHDGDDLGTRSDVELELELESDRNMNMNVNMNMEGNGNRPGQVDEDDLVNCGSMTMTTNSLGSAVFVGALDYSEDLPQPDSDTDSETQRRNVRHPHELDQPPKAAWLQTGDSDICQWEETISKDECLEGTMSGVMHVMALSQLPPSSFPSRYDPSDTEG